MRIGLIGLMRAGKDTIAEHLINKYGFKKLYFAEGIKEVIQEFFPNKLDENKKPRELYQNIGQFFRSIDNDVWVKRLDKKLESILAEDMNANVVVTDIRQRNEYDYLKRRGFVIVKVTSLTEVRLDRILNSGDLFTKASLTHETELVADSLPYDYVIENNGTLDELYVKVDELVKTVNDYE